MPPRFDPSGPYAITEEDVVYARPEGEALSARVYRPSGDGAPWPALVDVHGGAWTYFDRMVDQVFDRALAACGLVVAALDFRQGPAHRHPAAAADVAAGVRFVKANAARLGVRPDRVGLIGGSSGGHLALLVAVRPFAAEHATTRALGEDASSLVDATVAFALALWPIADPVGRYHYLLDRIAHPTPSHEPFFQPDRLRYGHEAYFGDERTMAAASVPRLLDDGEAERLPPAWIAHPELDENVTLAMTERVVDAYRRAGGEIELEVFPGVGHGFANFPGAASERCVARMAAFIGRQLARRTEEAVFAERRSR